MATATSNQVWISQWNYIWLVMDYTAGGGTFKLNSLVGYYSYTQGNAWDATSTFTHSISIPGGGGSFQSRLGPSGSGHGFGFGPEGWGGYAWDIVDAPRSYSGSGSGSVTITTTTSTGVSEINGKTFTFTGIDVGSSVTTPTLNDPSISNIGRTSANASFSVRDNGGASIIDNYIDCNTNSSFPSPQAAYINGTSGTFSGLTPNTTYYVRANASNGSYRGYSAVKSFKTTHNNPSIGGRTLQHSYVNSAINSKINSVVTYSTTYDNASYSSHSLVYGTSTQYGSTATSAGTGGSSKFNLSGLLPNTTYYYKITETDNTNQTSTATGSFTTPSRVKVVYPDGTVKAAKVKIV